MSIYNNNSLFHQLDLDLLKHFYAIATYGGFSKASRATGVSQPSLSLGLQRLEKSLEVTLIDRDSRQFQLTKPGLALLGFCQRLESGLDSVADALGTKGASVRRRLRIGTALSIGFTPLVDLCINASESGGAVDLELTAENSFQLLRKVNEGTLDAALVLDDVYESSLKFTKLAQDHLVLVVGPDTHKRLAGRDPRKALAETPLITYPRDTPMRSAVDKLRMQDRLPFKTVHSVTDIDAIKAFVLRDAGAAFALRSLVLSELKTRRLFEVELPFSLPRCDLMLATRDGEQGEAVARHIKSLLEG